MTSSAVFSPCGKHRMRLERDIQLEGIVVALIGVNPSTADATVNDATIRKEMGFGLRLGWRKIIKGNVFSYRATDVRELANVADHKYAENATQLRQIAADADIVVPCWGRRDKLPRHLRGYLEPTLHLLRSTGKPLFTFGFTAAGDPLHTLMLGYDTPLTQWVA